MALDVSLSWVRATDAGAWQRARTSAMKAAGDSVLLVGSSIRYGAPPALPEDTATLLGRAAERAHLAARPLELYTDGESDVDAAVVRTRLPSGSRVVVERPARRADVGVIGLESSPVALAGDSLPLRITVAAGETTPRAAELVISIDGRPVARRALRPFRTFEQRQEPMRVLLPAGPSEALLVVALVAADDAEARNDSASRVIHRGARMSAVAVSTSPDFDFREVARVLRGSLSLPTVVRSRVAEGRWVDDAGRPVAEAQVHAELRRADVALLHGDTGFFGPPRGVAAGALALMPFPDDESEWYLTAPLPSPLAGSLRSIEYDSLPPVAADPSPGGIPLLTARGGSQRTRNVGVLEDSTRRVIVLPVQGTARWALRGGVAADAFATFWGTVFATLADRPGRSVRSAPVVLPPHELRPQPPVLETGNVGDARLSATHRPLRDRTWLYVLLVTVLCAEWVLRRRIGLR